MKNVHANFFNVIKREEFLSLNSGLKVFNLNINHIIESSRRYKKTWTTFYNKWNVDSEFYTPFR